MSFEDIDRGERVRWALGQILVRGDVTLNKDSGGVLPHLWPSWRSWADCYRACRPAFLRWYNERPTEHPPYSELLFEAYQKGQNPADVVMPRPPDPRRLLAGKTRA